MLDTLNPNTPKANPQTAMQGIEISEQAAENLTPNQNKTADELFLSGTQNSRFEPSETMSRIKSGVATYAEMGSIFK